MKVSPRAIVFVGIMQLLIARVAFGQVMTHGPVIGGVTDTEAKIFVRTDQSATVVIQYSTDPTFQNPLLSTSLITDVASDFTAILPLTGLTPEIPITLMSLLIMSPNFLEITLFSPVLHRSVLPGTSSLLF